MTPTSRPPEEGVYILFYSLITPGAKKIYVRVALQEGGVVKYIEDQDGKFWDFSQLKDYNKRHVIYNSEWRENTYNELNQI